MALIKENFLLRDITIKDNPDMAKLIRTVMPEFGAMGCGFASEDHEVDCLFESYQGQGKLFKVITYEEKLVGGGGIGPLLNGAEDTCELKKMYFYPEFRGFGQGRELLSQLLAFAKKHYINCYLETLNRMNNAIFLYEKFGFQKLEKPKGNTGHHGCDTWYFKKL